MFQGRIALFVWLRTGLFAQFTTDQKISDFNQLAGLYAKNYGPNAEKKYLIGFDLYNVKAWLNQVAQSQDDISF